MSNPVNHPPSTKPGADGGRKLWTALGLAGLAAALGGAVLLGQPTVTQAQATGTQPYVVAADAPPGSETAIFAGGCFWCVEADFDKLPGVLSTTSGYTGGSVANPSYEQVSAKRTGHAEVVQIVFDPKRVSYAQLLTHFWRTIDPTTVDRQFCDVGSPYRTAIYAVGPQQLAAAKTSLAEIEKTKPFREAIVTPVVPASAFYAAEGYHQDYYLKNPLRYNYYRSSCGRDARLKELWGAQAIKH